MEIAGLIASVSFAIHVFFAPALKGITTVTVCSPGAASSIPYFTLFQSSSESLILEEMFTPSSAPMLVVGKAPSSVTACSYKVFSVLLIAVATIAPLSSSLTV